MALLFAKNNSLSAVTALPASVSGGALNLISTQTASSSATIDFTSGIDSTYKEYIFKFYDIHPSTDNVNLVFQADTGTNTNYNQTLTTTFFMAYNRENGTPSSVAYQADRDLAQSTSFQQLTHDNSNDNDHLSTGTLHLYNPSSSVFVKHFISRMASSHFQDYIIDNYSAGYFNITTAITRVQFKFSSGNIDSGTIKLYGVT
tara:strand:+ start:941 stop:1546 length:606 start_codon:yes stop_codon:yes gene_type:complete